MTRRKRAVFLLAVLMTLFMLINTPIVWKWMYPIKYQEEIMEASRRFQVDPYLVLAIIRSESAFRSDRVSKKGAVGLMQIMPDTAAWIVSQADFQPSTANYLVDPKMNIRIGTWYLSFLLTKFNGNYVKAIAAYNAGPGKVNTWLIQDQWNGTRERIEDIPIGETRHYLQRVLYYHDRYKKIYDHQLR
ncbi:lytic transglycosylase domain-containing protein [Brevibacillus sp. H7]|uniref:lytic transglycosylase domain-containing protein n=1 Tax=Brevibacillus sp. H7 TaxID=3349138 RepID=UPI0038071D60